MQLTEAFNRLKQLQQPVIQTRDVAAYLDLTIAHASKLLSRLAQHQLLVHINRGWWAFPEEADPLILPEYLTQPFPSYISLQTALYHHGMISQLPSVIYVVSLARTKVFSTVLGEISIHHLSTDFFFGFELLPGSFIKMATPEKALLDILYLSAAKSHLFRALPELELPAKFNMQTAHKIIKRISSPRRRTMVETRLKKICSL